MGDIYLPVAQYKLRAH